MKWLTALVAGFLLAMVSIVSAHAAPFEWKVVGADPCNPKVGCTLEWALGKTGWPKEVQSALKAKVQGESPVGITLERGWRGWMTGGSKKPWYSADTIAAWPSGQVEPADLWTLDQSGTRYHLIQVHKCKNWGGWTVSIPPDTTITVVGRKPPPERVPPVDEILGALPRVLCPEIK